MIDTVVAAIRTLASLGLVPRDLAVRPLGPDTLIDDLGADSLGKLELLTELEERADVGLSEGMLAGLRTLGQLADAIARLKEQP